MIANEKQTAIRIATVSVLLALISSPIAWFVAQEKAEESVVSLAIEESGRLLHQYNILDFNGENAQKNALQAAKTISGGLFDIAEIYNLKGEKLAEASTNEGRAVEHALPKHALPQQLNESYESIKISSNQWILRVFVPLRKAAADTNSPITGYFEGVRVVPEWQHQQMLSSALISALMVGLAALLCGLAVYPVVVHLSADNLRKTREVLDSHISMMEALGRAIAKRDSDTGAHNYRVAWIATCIVEKMNTLNSRRAMQGLIAGSFLHDVGKIGIPDAILLKAGKLTDDELKIMRTHVENGEQIVMGMGWLNGAIDVVAGHHEKWDGSGYPRQLSRENIPIAARIFAIADVFDALCSKRPYKEAMDFNAAMHILEDGTGSHFDPSVMNVFRSIAADIHQQLANTNEDGSRALLEERIKLHFEIQ